MTNADALLQDVLTRLDALERDNAYLRARNDHLEQTVANLLENTPTTLAPLPAASAPDQMNRRVVLRRGMQVAAATLAAGALLHETTQDTLAVENFDKINVNQPSDLNAISATSPGSGASTIIAKSSSGTALRGETNGSKAAVYGWNKGPGPAVRGESASANGAIEGISLNVDGVGIWGNGRTGVFGISAHADGAGVSGQGIIGVRGSSLTDNFTAIVGEHTGAVGYGVLGIGKGSGVGVLGRNTGGEAVRGEGMVGVRGVSSTSNYAAVAGDHTGTVGYGVSGNGTGSGAGVLGRNGAGDGVRGEGKTGVSGTSTTVGGAGVLGTNGTSDGAGVKGSGAIGVSGSSSKHGYEGVYGSHFGDFGFGVVGDGAGTGAGVLGRSPSGDGVSGQGKVGLRATSTATGGYGAVIEGGKAQLRLVPSATTGAPTSGSHLKGELVMDSSATLWVCTASGSPGTWRKVSTVAG